MVKINTRKKLKRIENEYFGKRKLPKPKRSKKNRNNNNNNKNSKSKIRSKKNVRCTSNIQRNLSCM